MGGLSRQPPLHVLRQKALAAAENRAKLEALLTHGPKRLGGDSSIRAVLSPVQAAAMAAERRLHDDVWCGSKSAESGGPSGDSKVSAVQDDRFVQTSAIGSVSQGKKDGELMWQCSSCTLLNQVMFLCFVCQFYSIKSGFWFQQDSLISILLIYMNMLFILLHSKL